MIFKKNNNHVRKRQEKYNHCLVGIFFTTKNLKNTNSHENNNHLTSMPDFNLFSKVVFKELDAMKGIYRIPNIPLKRRNIQIAS